MTQHETTTVTPVLHRRSVISDTDVEMLEAKFGNVPGVHYERSYMCKTCQRVYKKSEIMLVDGVPYCIPRRHYIDPLKDKKET